MNYNPFCLTDIRFSTKWQAVEQLLEIKNRNIAFIISHSSAERCNWLDLIKQLNNKNHLIWIDTVRANPTQIDVLQALLAIGKNPIDLIIAVGGGSAIDLAKGISAFYNNVSETPTIEEIDEGINRKSYIINNDFVDIIAIPTTAGTGSELTQWATIWDRNRQAKYSIDHPGLKPKSAIIIPELTLPLSQLLTLATGLDALSHAMEAYWSKYTNPMVQELVFSAVQLIIKYLPKVLKDPNCLSFREGMCRASVLAGISFSHTRTTACHSISYPLTMMYDVPHGLAAAMTLGEVAVRNHGSYPNDIRLEELFQPSAGIQNWLDCVSEGIVRLRLSEFEIPLENINLIVSNAFTSGRMDNNPVNFTETDVKEILINIYS